MLKKTIILIIATATACNEAKPAPAPKAAPPPQRNLAMEFAKDYMTTKFKVFENPDCKVWEDDGYGKTQSVMCTIGEVVGLYCFAGNGKSPDCSFFVDRRPKPEAPTAAKKEAPKKR